MIITAYHGMIFLNLQSALRIFMDNIVMKYVHCILPITNIVHQIYHEILISKNQALHILYHV